MGKKKARHSSSAWSFSDEAMYSSRAFELSGHEDEETRFYSHFQSPTVCILVGPQKAPFYLHCEVLKSKCPFFQTRADFLAKGQLEDEGTIFWQEITSCEAFAMFVEHVYTFKYTLPSRFSVADACDSYAHLYRLADYLMMDDLKQTALDKMERLLKDNSSTLWGNELSSAAVVKLHAAVYDDTINK
ncbi:hypothetical protein LTR05_008597 [Lithohypha guttulata]|uniref:BTB domain-containing protein n=1 Tax=Lithohypha guttulata TaxID=1690604 RepID=A0AAN7SRX2_9EURO|nr:hypothetical protein LTR05_008597 [Lithohypha guttulata]